MKHLKLLLAIVGMLVSVNALAASKDFDLHQAVLDNDIQLVKRLLSKGAAIDLIGSRKHGYGSALHLAVREGHVEIAILLLKRGAEVDVLDPDDFTPLHNAAWNGNLDMTKLLLDAGADIEASTYDGDTPLSLAQNNDQTQVAEFLQAKLQASVKTKTEPTTVSDTGIVDISGTYAITDLVYPDEVTRYKRYILGDGNNLEISIVQIGEAVTGAISGEVSGKFNGELKGNEITFELDVVASGASKYGNGNWFVSEDASELRGVFELKGGHYGVVKGKWNFRKLE
jgi:hypothetical protein